MKKIWQVALREFLSTIGTKSFLLGLIIPPVLIASLSLIMPMVLNDEAPRIEGELAIIDRSDTVFEALKAYLKPEAIAKRRGAIAETIKEHTPEVLQGVASAQIDGALEDALGDVPLITVSPVPDETETQKAALLEEARAQGSRLALMVVDANAVIPNAGEETLGRYELYVREKLDDRLIDEFKSAAAHVIRMARLRARQLDPEEIDALTTIGRVRPVVVTAEGDKRSNQVLNTLLPMGFMGLLIAAVMTGGAYLLTSTIEEKSNRVVEVLLSAISPLQLMAGKILGQMAVGLIVLAVYGGMAVIAMTAFALLGLIELSLFFYLFIFFIIAYLTIGSFLAAIGAAANEMREAQSLQMPVIMTMMIPWMLWLPLSRDPNSTLATVLSFLPPISPMVMMLRICSSSPPPTWQVLLAIVIGAVSVVGVIWGAAKVFRVGLLLHGKAPNYRTLMRWIRMA